MRRDYMDGGLGRVLKTQPLSTRPHSPIWPYSGSSPVVPATLFKLPPSLGLSDSRLISALRSMYLSTYTMATTMVHVRVDEKTKEKAAKTLAGMGSPSPMRFACCWFV